MFQSRLRSSSDGSHNQTTEKKSPAVAKKPRSISVFKENQGSMDAYQLSSGTSAPPTSNGTHPPKTNFGGFGR